MKGQTWPVQPKEVLQGGEEEEGKEEGEEDGYARHVDSIWWAKKKERRVQLVEQGNVKDERIFATKTMDKTRAWIDWPKAGWAIIDGANLYLDWPSNLGPLVSLALGKKYDNCMQVFHSKEEEEKEEKTGQAKYFPRINRKRARRMKDEESQN